VREWPLVRLGELVTLVDRFEAVVPTASYRLLGVRLEGNGTFHRETVKGTETSASRLNRVETGDFIFSRLYAWRGAFGIIPPEQDGAFVSNEFPIFCVDENRLHAQYLKRWFELPAVWSRVLEDCTGSTPTTRNRFKERYFLDLEIPLPPLPEQHATVARLYALTDKTRQLTAHLDAIESEANALVLALHHNLAKKRAVSLSEVIELQEDPVPIRLDETYPQVGVRGFGGGLFAKPAISATDTTYRAFNRLYPDAIVLSQVKGWEGAIALTPPSLVGMFASPEYRTFRCLPEKASPDYLGKVFGTPWFWSLLQDATRGVGARRERTRPEQFLNVTLPMPAYDEQIKAVEIFSRLNALNTRHTSIREANDSLLPATLERLFNKIETADRQR
jgi:type I restriction enzyme S subunit